MMKYNFFIVNVFTDKKLSGGSLVVFLDCEGMDDGAMLAIAREFSSSEVVFVMEPKDPVNSARIKIFNNKQELPLSGGGAVLGSAALIAKKMANGHLSNGIIIAIEGDAIDGKDCVIPVEVSKTSGGVIRSIIELQKKPEMLNIEFNIEKVAKALKIDVLDIGFGAHGISTWEVDIPFIMIPIKDLSTMLRVYPSDVKTWREAFASTGNSSVFLYTRETVLPNHHVHARTFIPEVNVIEVPAIGSAVAAFAGLAATIELPEDGNYQIIIEQGFEIKRPSLTSLDLHIRSGRIENAIIGGSVIEVGGGWIET